MRVFGSFRPAHQATITTWWAGIIKKKNRTQQWRNGWRESVEELRMTQQCRRAQVIATYVRRSSLQNITKRFNQAIATANSEKQVLKTEARVKQKHSCYLSLILCHQATTWWNLVCSDVNFLLLKKARLCAARLCGKRLLLKQHC